MCPGRTVWKIDSVDEVDANHAVAMKAQIPYSLEAQGMLTVLKTVLGSKFFEVLLKCKLESRKFMVVFRFCVLSSS